MRNSTRRIFESSEISVQKDNEKILWIISSSNRSEERDFSQLLSFTIQDKEKIYIDVQSKRIQKSSDNTTRYKSMMIELSVRVFESINTQNRLNFVDSIKRKTTIS